MKKRLTERIYGGYTIAVNGKIYYDEVADIAERLAEYEDAEEAGLLVRLPCKVGDKVYRICGIGIDVENVNGIYVVKNEVPYLDFGWTQYSARDIGDILFFTREEAEKRLKELKGDAE